MASKKRRIQLIGTVFDVTDGVNVGGEFAAGWNFNFESEVQQLPFSNHLGKQSFPTGKNYTGEIRITELTPSIVARITGCAVENGRRTITRETITKSGSTVTLTNGGGTNQSIIKINLIRDTVNNTDRYVAGSAVAGDAVTISGAVLTCHASDTGTTFYVEYEWQDTSASAGSKIIDLPTSMPGFCELHFAYALVDPDTNLPDKTMIVQCKKCLIKGLSLGADAQAILNVPLAVDIVNKDSGDVVYWFDNYNPTAVHA